MGDKVQPNKRKYSSFTGILKGPKGLTGHNTAASPGSIPSGRVPSTTGTAPPNAAGTGVSAPLGLILCGHAPQATGTAIPDVSGTSAPISHDLRELQKRITDLAQQSHKTNNILSTISNGLAEHQQRISALERPCLLDPIHPGTGQSIEPAPMFSPLVELQLFPSPMNSQWVSPVDL
ncbi:hypothetical protein DL766_005006 [Monosporascus sp. MC13-8B]|nr:hypothetical protein DL766_005006 [Monosporascus sp. MC13-8B]